MIEKATHAGFLWGKICKEKKWHKGVVTHEERVFATLILYDQARLLRRGPHFVILINALTALFPGEKSSPIDVHYRVWSLYAPLVIGPMNARRIAARASFSVAVRIDG